MIIPAKYIVRFFEVQVQSNLDRRDVHQSVNDGVDGEACRTVNLQLAGNIAAVGDDGIGGDAEVIGNFLVRHALHERDDDILLTVGEGF